MTEMRAELPIVQWSQSLAFVVFGNKRFISQLGCNRNVKSKAIKIGLRNRVQGISTELCARLRRNQTIVRVLMVRDTGFEPVTPTVSR